MKTEKIARPERIEIFTSAQLTIPSKDFEENPEVMEMSVLIEIARIEDEDNDDDISWLSKKIVNLIIFND